MSISPFFHHLKGAYQAELNDLFSDSEGKDVLQRRLAERRKEIGFLLQMMELSPEMVAVIFHQGFEFKQAAVMDDVLSRESDDLPDWASLSDAIGLNAVARDLSRVVLKEPKGAWFLTVAAALEYMYHRADAAPANDDAHDDDQDEEHADNMNDDMGHNKADGSDAADERDAKSREEAGADWLAEQGFDRKE
jgi:hypothetical protein